MMRSPKSNRATDSLGNQAFLLFSTAMDTTWRLFVPTISFTFLGIFLDHSFITKPLLTAIMVVVGCLISAVLIALQYRSIKNDK